MRDHGQLQGEARAQPPHREHRTRCREVGKQLLSHRVVHLQGEALREAAVEAVVTVHQESVPGLVRGRAVAHWVRLTYRGHPASVNQLNSIENILNAHNIRLKDRVAINERNENKFSLYLTIVDCNIVL